MIARHLVPSTINLALNAAGWTLASTPSSLDVTTDSFLQCRIPMGYQWNRPLTRRPRAIRFSWGGILRRYDPAPSVAMTKAVMIPRLLMTDVARYLARFGCSPLTAPPALIRDALAAIADPVRRSVDSRAFQPRVPW